MDKNKVQLYSTGDSIQCPVTNQNGNEYIYICLGASWETCMEDRKQQLELNMEQQTGSKSEKEYVKAVYCHPAYFYMQSTSLEMLD